MSSRECVTIAFDGPDGVGKTTQLELFSEFLKAENYRVHTTRSSGGTEIGEKLREVSLCNSPRPAETDMHISLAMGYALGGDLKQKRLSNDFILIDRSPLSIVAYNAFGSQMEEPEEGIKACDKMLEVFDIDVLIVFNATRHILEQRLKERKNYTQNDYFEQQGSEYLKRVCTGYKEGVKHVKEKFSDRIGLVEIDANPPINSVQEQIRAKVNTLLND